MRTLILIITLLFLISCNKKNTHVHEKVGIKFSTEKIIIEDLSKIGGNLNYHFVIKIENSTENQISLPIIDLQNHGIGKNETKFHLQANGKIYSTFSYLIEKENEILSLNSNDKGYILLSLTENINPDDIESGSLLYIDAQDKKTFPTIETNTRKIVTDHKITIEEAIKLIHGKINGKQY